MQAINKLFQGFEDAGIDYMPVKGCNLKYLYPKPELRPMGDADILIRETQLPQCAEILKSQDFALKLESEHTDNWQSDALYVELHKSLVPPEDADYYSYYGDGWRFAVKGAGFRYDPTPEDTFVFLFTHFARHYRESGIGCRHVLDLWIYTRTYPQIDTSYICRELDKLYLLEFYQNMNILLDVWFNDKEIDIKSQFISDHIFKSGIWGDLVSRDIADNVQMYQSVGKVVPGKFVYFFGRVFPNYEVLSCQYPVLRQYPYLVPIMWVVRWFRIIFRNPALIARRFKMLENRSNDKILAWEQNMADIGLRFWHDSEK